MTTIADELLAQAAEAGERVGQLWQRANRGEIGLPEFYDAASTIVVAGRERAVALVLRDFAEKHLAELGSLPAVVVPAIADSAEINRARFVTISRRIVNQSDAAEPGPRIERLARAEIARTAQDHRLAVIDQNGATVLGYTRQTDGDACDLCLSWADDGAVFSTDTEFHAHPQCCCVPEAVYSRASS